MMQRLLLSILFSHVLADQLTISTTPTGAKECTLLPIGSNQDDVPNILSAFSECNNGGTITFPRDKTFRIATRLNPKVNNITIKWQGEWRMSDNLTYWRQNSYPIEFQNHAASFILSGSDIRIDGFGTGGIHGNGDTWYTAEAGRTQPGRPMPFVLWHVSDVVVRNFYVLQPPLWAINIMNGTNLDFENIYVNATATKAPWGANWVQNTDGFDTMDARNVRLRNFIYQGGDDCVAVKPRSFNIEITNSTCRGGNGMAIGSLGQYLEDSSVENVVIRDVKIIRYNEDMHNCAYIKTWIGEQVLQNNYESAGLPRGGGWGIVRNVTFSNFDVDGADGPPSITQDNGNADKKHGGTSKMEVSNVVFENFRGHLHGGRSSAVTASVSCSKVKPCFDIVYRGMQLRPKKDAAGFGEGKCRNIRPGGVVGIKGDGC